MAEAVGKPGAAEKPGPIRNVLFIMADQFRWDYMGCAGHPTLSTPVLDGLARRGVRFTNAYVQSAICGPSRMSFYSGLYMANHGATVLGESLDKALWRMEELEVLARTYLLSSIGGAPHILSNDQIAEAMVAFASYGPKEPPAR